MLSQEISPGTMAGLEKTLKSIERRFAGKRKDNPIPIDEAKRDCDKEELNEQNKNHNNNNKKDDKELRLNFSNISNAENNSVPPLNLNDTFDQNNTIDLTTLNNNLQYDNYEIITQLRSNVKSIDKVNDNLMKMNTLNLSDHIEDDLLIEYHENLRINFKNIYELKCIIYKIKAHIAAGFIPRYDRIRGYINNNKKRNVTKENYNYIYNTLNGYAEISKNNQINKLKLKNSKIQHYEKVNKFTINEFEEKIKDKIKKLSSNKYSFNNQIIKQAILNNFHQQINRTNCLNIQLKDYYDDEYDKFKF